MPPLVRGSAQSHYKMLAANVQCRDMMRIEDDDRLRTIDCLRGRLQAERVTSKAAKEEAWHLAKRLEELEKKLAEEIKLRNRAEKRLQYAVQKLRSLELVNDRSAADLPASSTTSSASKSFLGRQGPEGRESCPPAEGSGQCAAAKEAAVSAGSDCLSDGSSATLSHQFASVDNGSWSSTETAQSHNKCEACTSKSHEELPDDFLRVSSNYDNKQEIDTQEPDGEENKLALVPVSHQPKSEPVKVQTEANVQDVLLALRTVKQQLLYTLQQRAGVYTQKDLFATQAHTHKSSTTWHRSY